MTQEKEGIWHHPVRELGPPFIGWLLCSVLHLLHLFNPCHSVGQFSPESVSWLPWFTQYLSVSQQPPLRGMGRSPPRGVPGEPTFFVHRGSCSPFLQVPSLLQPHWQPSGSWTDHVLPWALVHASPSPKALSSPSLPDFACPVAVPPQVSAYMSFAQKILSNFASSNKISLINPFQNNSFCFLYRTYPSLWI